MSDEEYKNKLEKKIAIFGSKRILRQIQCSHNLGLTVGACPCGYDFKEGYIRND